MIAPTTKPRTWHTEATSTSVIRHSAMLLHRRLTVVTLTTVILLVAVATITMMTGRYPLAPADILAVLTGGGNQLDSYILFGVRLPRLAITMLAGVALGYLVRCSKACWETRSLPQIFSASLGERP